MPRNKNPYMDGMYKVKNIDIKIVKIIRWQKSAGLKAGTESLIIVEQDQSLPIRNYQANIIKKRIKPNM